MSGKRIEMFRIKIHRAKQGKLLASSHPALSLDKRVSAMVKCVRDKPEFAADAGSVWRIGDVKAVSSRNNRVMGLAFQFGKTFVEDDDDFDMKDKVYRSEQKKRTKHTMVYMDVGDETRIFGGIATPTRVLAPNAVRVADALKNAINQRLADANQDVEVSIDPVYNTEKFEQQLLGAHAVTVLSVSFGRPNDPLDVKGMLYKPATQMSEEMEADESTHIFKGAHLKDAVGFARNAADGGFTVSARIKESPDSRSKKIAPKARWLEKVEVGEDAEEASVLGKIAAWMKSRKNGKGES